MVKRKTILKWMLTTLWVTIGAGVVVLLVAAVQKEAKQKCMGLNVVVKGVSNNFFVDKNDILIAIDQYVEGSPIGQAVNLLNLKDLESDLEKNIWVKKAQLYVDNNAVLQVIVTEREPVARIFTSTGATFYIDSSNAMLPLSEKYSARLPVFTSFPSESGVLTKADSLLIKDIAVISKIVQKNPFWMAMIEQVDITKQRTFELVPKIGNSLICFGDATNAAEKLDRLLLFYKQVLVKCGWDYYSSISVQYANQVVAKRKGAEDKTADSLRTLQMMQMIAWNAEHLANDSAQTIVLDNEKNSTNVSLIQQSIERDDNGESIVRSETTNPQGIPVVEHPVLKNPLPVKNKPVIATSTVVKHNTAKPIAPKPAVTKTIVVFKKPVTEKVKPANKSAPVQVKPKPAIPKSVMPKPTIQKPNNEY